MMKRIFKRLLILLLVISFIPVTPVFAEELTFGKFLDDLASAEAELNKNNQQITDKQNEIIANNKKIQSLKSEIQKMSEETNKLQQEIADSNEKIKSKEQQTKDVVVYLQMSSGENIYLDYVFGGEDITDLIYRLSVVEQITEYNDSIIKELEELIQSNEKRKVELANKEKEYEKKITDIDNEISRITSSLANLGSLSPSLKQEVENKKKLVDFYKSQGCSNRNDIIGRDCAVTSSNATFTRPIEVGYVTSFIGYRGGSQIHRGIDLGSPYGRNTALYSIGFGRITSIWQDGNGANCVTVEYRTVDGVYYTAIYGHLSRYANIWVGMDVTPNTILGYMGDTGYSFGVHLHLEVWPCRLYGDSNCRSWNDYVNFANRKYREGFKGAESVINFPSRTYQTWYNK